MSNPRSSDESLLRIRHALGLADDAPLPPPTPETLQTYHNSLTAHLRLPLEVGDESARGPGKLWRLLPPDQVEPGLGLLAEVERAGQTTRVPLAALVALDEQSDAGERLRDYALWIWLMGMEKTLAGASGSSQGDCRPEAGGDRWAVWRSLGLAAVYTAGAGAVLGAVLAAVPGASSALGIGAVVLGVAGYLTGGRTSHLFAETNPVAAVPAVASFLGLVLGGLLGGVLGVLTAAVLGTVPGCIAGSVLSRLTEALGRRLLHPVTWVVLGGFTGAAILALISDRALALEGASAGSLVGAGAGLSLVLLALVGAALSARRAG